MKLPAEVRLQQPGVFRLERKVVLWPADLGGRFYLGEPGLMAWGLEGADGSEERGGLGHPRPWGAGGHGTQGMLDLRVWGGLWGRRVVSR